ncbi:MAG: cell division protein ZapA [Deltaproteobacteria bacterium]|nr:cell division protein ZapA [Deltaproteobacteria bacterium]
MKERFCINILGQEISVLSDSGDEHVRKVVDYINEKAEGIGKESGNMTTLNIAILVALNIADEYFKAKQVEEELCSQLESRSERLINLIKDIS